MSRLTTEDAKEIARKLHASIARGRKHDRAAISWKGKVLGHFGISRGSRPQPHDYVAAQIGVTMRQAVDLARCTLEEQDYFDLMASQGKIDKEDDRS